MNDSKACVKHNEQVINSFNACNTLRGIVDELTANTSFGPGIKQEICGDSKEYIYV